MEDQHRSGRTTPMPKKTGDDPYGYDPKTDTVRVRRHDLARLLLEFRSLAERQEPQSWSHMHDYDRSFERLADAVDAGDQVFHGHRYKGPDYRMRCSLSPAYEWPEKAPYDGGEVSTVQVIGHGSHYVPNAAGGRHQALCGLWWTPEEGKPIAGEPSCPECRREPLLVQFLRSPA
ncbi:hypothetical protein [Streptosporangium saharense]|uniref:hypothetical protein n=1 Tax=Streptosporangium saharense TaxID=1706840 RepID=UPI0036774FE7